MLSFFKKKKDISLYAPVNGKAIALEEVKDQVFASKMMGDGIAFQFEEDTLYSPCDGEVSMIPPTLHAYGFTLPNGAEILVHIGLDTVALNGKGFEVLVKQGDKVKVGDPIVKIDQAFMKSKGIDLTTPMIVAEGNNHTFVVKNDLEDVKIKKDKVIYFE